MKYAPSTPTDPLFSEDARSTSLVIGICALALLLVIVSIFLVQMGLNDQRVECFKINLARTATDVQVICGRL